MYNLAVIGNEQETERIKDAFGDKYDLTDDLSQTNVLALCSMTGTVPDLSPAMESRLLFAVCDLTKEGLSDEMVKSCTDSGISVFRCVDDLVGYTDNIGEHSNDIGEYANDIGENANDIGEYINDIVEHTRDFIENGNISGSINYPDVQLGPFGDDVSRIVMMMHGIDDPILLAAMIFSGMDVRAIAGGLMKPTDSESTKSDSADNEYGCALISLREPVTRLPHVDGVLKVRVLQDI